MTERHEQLLIFIPRCDVCGVRVTPSKYGWLHREPTKEEVGTMINSWGAVVLNYDHPDYMAYSKSRHHVPKVTSHGMKGLSSFEVYRLLAAE